MNGDSRRPGQSKARQDKARQDKAQPDTNRAGMWL